MANTQGDVVSAAALGKLKEADFICLIEEELRAAYKAEQTRIRNLHDEKAEKLLALSKEKEAIEANIIRDCQIALAMDDGFSQLAYRFKSVTTPSLFQPFEASKCQLLVESTKLDVYSGSISVTLTLVVRDDSPTTPDNGTVVLQHPLVRAPVTFNMPIPENLQNVVNKMSELRKQQAELRKALDKAEVRNVGELARNVLAKARLKALTGSETVFKPEALLKQLQ